MTVTPQIYEGNTAPDKGIGLSITSLNEPKKETVRITLPPPPVENPPGSGTVRITLPPRPPANGLPNMSPPLPPTAPVGPGNYPGPPPLRAEPKKETARISVLPDFPQAPPRSKTVKMTKTQPLITMPEIAAPHVPITVAISNVSGVSGVMNALDSIPRPLCWGLLGISALLFIIQLWAYFS